MTRPTARKTTAPRTRATLVSPHQRPWLSRTTRPTAQAIAAPLPRTEGLRTAALPIRDRSAAPPIGDRTAALPIGDRTAALPIRDRTVAAKGRAKATAIRATRPDIRRATRRVIRVEADGLVRSQVAARAAAGPSWVRRRRFRRGALAGVRFLSRFRRSQGARILEDLDGLGDGRAGAGGRPPRQSSHRTGPCPTSASRRSPSAASAAAGMGATMSNG